MDRKISERSQMGMDSETGEVFPDLETGEITYSPQLNEETGEKEYNYLQNCNSPKRRFKIPNNYLQRYFSSHKHALYRSAHDDRHLSELATAIVFLLPTVLFFPIVAALITLIEAILHQYTHKLNRLNDNDLIYFQSPLHFLVKEYCWRCKEEASKNRISEIQDMRNKLRKYDLDCVGRMVT